MLMAIISDSQEKKNDDNPLLMFLELIGNDVCDHRHSFDAMTTPEDFRKNTIKMLDWLDENVPAGSHLVILGVVNGSLLYEGTAGRTHPLGITYDRLYDFQNCVESSFCWGWLQTDATIREKTTQRAQELNQVYKDLINTYKPKNFDFAYYDFPAGKIFNEYRDAGNDVMDLIEPVDGFHPSQLFHAKLADYLWETLLKDHPDWVGPVNPNNDLITQLFGNQGGY
jgi:acyloxyacyl hydrolase